MARGNGKGVKGSSRRRVQQREDDSEESDEEYRATEDDDCDESDEFYTLDGDASEDILDDFGELRRVSRSRNVRKSSSSKKVNGIVKPQKRRKLVYTKNDDDDDDIDEDEDAEFISLGRECKRKDKPMDKKRVSYTEDDDDDDFGNQIKASRRKRTGSYKGENQEEEDEKESEFKLSESDFVADEDETPKVKKNDKVRKFHTRKKSVRGGQKKCQNSKLKSPTTPNQINHRSGQKLGSSKEKSVTKNRNKKKRRKQMEMAESDSDFVNSASSDHDYTISEEEREQMKEARVYCANFRDKFRRSSCENQQHRSVHEQRKYQVRKGKEKIADTKHEATIQVCGICLSEERKRTLRGVLNCCQHYFCFSCIMEWSKVESRCPLCKQRFATITKAAKSDTGFGSKTVVIPVPECDQVYEPSEEELRGYLDPYESVMCTECHYGGDDALMLLCDICDSSAHTYCVGLGREVPEGNWYCEGCKPTVFGTTNSQQPTPNSNATDLSSPIVVGFDLNELYVPETPLAQQTRVLPEPMPAAPLGNVAITLRDRRRTRRQIHHHFLNNNNNRTSDFVGRSSGTLASSSGIRLFGSWLDQYDHIFPSQNSDLASVNAPLQDQHVGSHMGMGFDSRLGYYAQLHPYTNRSSMMVDACRELCCAWTSQGGLHTPY